MKKTVRIPEQPSEQPKEKSREQAQEQVAQPRRVETPQERQIIEARVRVIEGTRGQLRALAERIPPIEGVRKERFVA